MVNYIISEYYILYCNIMYTIGMNILERIEELRTQRGLSVYELTEMSGLLVRQNIRTFFKRHNGNMQSFGYNSRNVFLPSYERRTYLQTKRTFGVIRRLHARRTRGDYNNVAHENQNELKNALFHNAFVV